jgi:hypothetical protein
MYADNGVPVSHQAFLFRREISPFAGKKNNSPRIIIRQAKLFALILRREMEFKGKQSRARDFSAALLYEPILPISDSRADQSLNRAKRPRI